MYERIKRLYEAGRLTAEGVLNAAKKGLITEAQAEEIIAEEYAEKIRNGEMTLSDVPKEWRDKVAILLHK